MGSAGGSDTGKRPKKELSHMTLEELWQLFPIVLIAHNPAWPLWYEEERGRLASLLPTNLIARISHIGSTAVKSIRAKPTIDILVETVPGYEQAPLEAALTEAGYIRMSFSPGRSSFNKGYTPEGYADRVFHLHLRQRGDNDELYFRDYLKDHPKAAHEYEKLKLQLWKMYEYDRDGYTESKTDFIKEHTRKAKALYGERYP